MKILVIFALVLSLMFSITTSGCVHNVGLPDPGLAPKIQLVDTGLFGEHRIHSRQTHYFHKIDNFIGKESQPYRIYWEMNPNHIISSVIPYYKFRFIIDGSKDIPTIEFFFHKSWLHEGRFEPYSLAEKIDLNYFLENYLKIAAIRISWKTLQNEEINLPSWHEEYAK